ncbi:MAG: SPOR domain-containing protein [Burkholderiales bacterium]|nr:SPOR domain-containing protein [Burkholderiales bacterium]
MSKDYKQSNRKPKSSGKSSGGGSSVFAGLLIGLCLGVAIAVAAALYLNKVPNPFAKHAPTPPVAGQTPPATPAAAAQQPPATAPTGLPTNNVPAAQAGQTPAANGQPAQPNGQQTGDRFDFYTMLPGLAEPKSGTPAKPESTPPTTVEPPKGMYLQAGSFQNESDADNLKAKLALMGVEATIQTIDVAGKGVVHRVRVGPLASADDVDRVRAQLRVNGVEPTVVKN